MLISFIEICDEFWSTKKLSSLLLHVNQDLLDIVQGLRNVFEDSEDKSGCVLDLMRTSFKNKMFSRLYFWK